MSSGRGGRLSFLQCSLPDCNRAIRGSCGRRGYFFAAPIEAKLDEAAEKLGAAAKEQAANAARNAVEKAPEIAGNATRTVAQKAPEVAGNAARVVARKAPEVAGKTMVATVKAAPKVAGAAAKAAKAGVGFVVNRRKGR